jgi:aquaporin NIP
MRQLENSLGSDTFRKLIAEFVATFAMVLFGTGAMVLNDISHGQVGLFGIALTFGVVVTVMIYFLGPVSGAHMNPAVTLSLAAARKFRVILVLPYVCSQSLGAILASYLLSKISPGDSTLGATTPQGSIALSFIVELLLGYVLIFVILQIVKRSPMKRFPAAVIVGLIIALGAIFAGHISGASMNPARSLAPAIVSEQYQGLWIYLFAPAIGGLLAVQSIKLLDRPFYADRNAAFQERV